MKTIPEKTKKVIRKAPGGANGGTVTIADVARAAGASIATVSRVFNNHPHVSQTTADRVNQAMETLGYRPNAYSRSLRSGQTQTIGILRLSSAVGDELYWEVMSNNLVRCISAEGYGVAMETYAEPVAGRVVKPELIAAKRVSALAIVGHLGAQELKQIEEWGVPVCLINNRYDGKGFYSSSLNDFSGSREAVQYLVALGRRNIAFVHGNLEWPGTNGRYRGYVETLRELGLAAKPEYLVKVPDTQQNYAGGFDATKQLLGLARPPDAIFYVNDWYAIGGLAAAQSLGRRIPDDLNIVGYDNSWMASQVVPQLTTVSLEAEEICHRAVAMLIRAVENKPDVIVHAQVRPRLLVRDSTTVWRGTDHDTIKNPTFDSASCIR